MRRLLLIEDDPLVGGALSRGLREEYHVALAASLAEADRILAQESFDLIVLDGSLPDGDGYRYCAKLRSQSAHKGTPIIFLTANGELQDKIMGFSVGADDYLTKPFQLEELKLRIVARLRHSQALEDRASALVLGDLTLDTRYHKASISQGGADVPLSLTSLEFKLLHYLASRDGEVCSREELIAAIWGQNVHVTERTVDTHLSNLRKKLSASEWTIRSVHGVGYHWVRKETAERKAS